MPPTAATGELANLLDVADALLTSAVVRTESRGRARPLGLPADRPVVAPSAGARHAGHHRPGGRGAQAGPRRGGRAGSA